MAANDSGPFDIIGDVHGCCSELEQLLRLLGYRLESEALKDSIWGPGLWSHPQGRLAVFLGDLADRGPRVLDTFRLAINMIDSGNALCVCGNHDDKLRRQLMGREVKVSHGLERSLAEINRFPGLREPLIEFIGALPTHLVLDGRKLIAAHGGLKEELHGQDSSEARHFALYGDATGEIDQAGYPVRRDWAAGYRGEAAVVYGHTPVREPEWINNTVNIDTGCVFGGRLTALRYPERQFVSVKAERAYVPHQMFQTGAGSVLT
jgi:protein phosphatase